jgi:hypothetical protein
MALVLDNVEMNEAEVSISVLEKAFAVYRCVDDRAWDWVVDFAVYSDEGTIDSEVECEEGMIDCLSFGICMLHVHTHTTARTYARTHAHVCIAVGPGSLTSCVDDGQV